MAVGSDDAEESASGTVTLANADLELVFDGSNQTVGLRFTGVGIAKGATISNAYIQFKVDETSSEATTLTIQGEASDNATTFTKTGQKVSLRPRTSAAVTWSPSAWTTVAEVGPNQRTSNISGVIQEIVNRGGWTSGNSLAIIVTGSGRRVAESFEGDAAGAPLLHVEIGPPPANQPPNVDAGPDQTVALLNGASLDGTASDDGLPNPPGMTETTWSKASGPGTVTFADERAVDTTASFSTSGTYVLRLTADDGALISSDDTTVTVLDAGPSVTFEVRVTLGTDDAEENAAGSVTRTSADLDLVTDGTSVQTVGMRFNTVTIPKGATIDRAYVQFKVDETSSGGTSLTIQGQASDNAETFAKTTKGISSRPRTAAAVSWSPPAWNTVGQAGLDQRTLDLSAVVQEIVSRTGWMSGNSLAIIVTGSGTRVAESFEGDSAGAPLLHVEYR